MDDEAEKMVRVGYLVPRDLRQRPGLVLKDQTGRGRAMSSASAPSNWSPILSALLPPGLLWHNEDLSKGF